MAKDEKKEGFSTAMTIASILITGITVYWQLAPSLVKAGYNFVGFNRTLLFFRILIENTYTMRLYALLFVLASAMMKTMKKEDIPLKKGLLWSAAGTAIFLLPTQHMPPLYFATCVAGLSICTYGYSLIFRRLKGGKAPEEDSFLQNDALIETEYSINIPYHYTYQKRLHKAWLDIVAPFRGSIVLGVPGSGKSFAIYNKCIEDMVRKGYTMFLYDYKFPDLTEELLTEIHFQRHHEGLWEKDKVKPKLYILNFDDPRKSNRCNPIHHSYITDPADTTEIADLLFKNINKGASKNGFDFFNESAKVYLDALTWYLANYDPDWIPGGEDGYTVVGSTNDFKRKGCFCTFPHIIELMAYNYKKVFQILQYTHGLEAKVSPFASALEGGAMEQLQGQIASAQIPLGKFVSPALYWIMTGDDFTLDINNPEEPKIVCMGNNPDRQSIYGSAIALYTSRMFKLINHKGRRHSAVLFDELPTVFIKGLDNLIATARSNKVAIILGAQDRSQLYRDYGADEAKVIFNTVGNILSGQVNEETAESLSKMFGKEFREQQSKTINDDSDSTSISFQLQEILPASKISTLTQGTFFGRLADNFDTPIERKLFCGAIDINTERNKQKKKEWQRVPIMTDFFDGKLPTLSPEDKERLAKLNPKISNRDDLLLEKYIQEVIDDIVKRNFQSVKDDVKWLVEKEYEFTKPFAEADRERRKAEEGED
ncbi:MAG: TraM recognition domain-containing protein [Bacteroidales bacterium]|nr:TraM recognition domain-containing protein [Bacteroidales bacterium]